MPQKFRLFDLPFLALKVILEIAGPQFVFCLSLCSKRSKYRIINQGKIFSNINLSLSPFEISIQNGNLVATVENSSALSEHHGLQSVTIRDSTVPAKIHEQKKGCLVTYWSDKNQGLIEIAKYASEIFNQKIHSLTCNNTVTPLDIIFVLDFINNFQESVYQCTISSGQLNDKQILYILGNLNVTGHLSFASRPSRDFQGPPTPRPFFMDTIHFYPSRWITVDQLAMMDCKVVILDASVLTCKELNTFLKKWTQGECSRRIQELTVEIDEILNYEELLDGIEVTRREPQVTREFLMYWNISKTIEGGLDIKRAHDGAIATIENHIAESAVLRVIFWPKEN